MKKRVILLMFVICMMLSLVGCVDVESGIVIDEDGSGIYTGYAAINKDLVGEEYCDVQNTEFKDLNGKPPVIEPISYKDDRGYFEGEKATYKFKNSEELNDLDDFNIYKTDEGLYTIKIDVNKDYEKGSNNEETLNVLKESGARAEFYIIVDGEVKDHTADRVEDDKYIWDLLDLEKGKEVKLSYKLNDIKHDNSEILGDLNIYGKKLQELGILKGTEKGLDLDSELTRVQGMLIYSRILGVNEEDLDNFADNTCRFDDVPDWAWNEISYMYSNGFIKGISETKLGSNNMMTAEQFMTLLLRSLGYDDSDFVWNKSLEKAVELGIISGEDAKILTCSNEFSRGYMSYLTYKVMEGHY